MSGAASATGQIHTPHLLSSAVEQIHSEWHVCIPSSFLQYSYPGQNTFIHELVRSDSKCGFESEVDPLLLRFGSEKKIRKRFKPLNDIFISPLLPSLPSDSFSGSLEHDTRLAQQRSSFIKLLLALISGYQVSRPASLTAIRPLSINVKIIREDKGEKQKGRGYDSSRCFIICKG